MANNIRETRNIKIVVAYDGSAYHGFQRQDNAITVQQVLEQRLAPMFGHPLTLHGSARTDTGVHACGQVANFHTTGTVPSERLVRAAKGVLPTDIVLREAYDVDFNFHARRSAKSKVYVYRVFSSPVADPFLRNYAWHVLAPLDIEAMKQALPVIEGTHDFSAFRATGGATSNSVRTVYETMLTQVNKTIEFRIRGNGFLYHMVRNIMGTLVEIGNGKRSAINMAMVLASKDRSKAAPTAPPQGLYLQEVYYQDTPGSVFTKI